MVIISNLICSADHCNSMHVSCWEGWRNSSSIKRCNSYFIRNYTQEGSSGNYENKAEGISKLSFFW